METAIRNPLPLTALSEQIGRLKKSQLALDFFEKPRTSPDNQLEIIRRWNSHSPMLTDSYGGGYFIRWRGKGIVIDPGCTFLRAFRRQHRHMRRHRMIEESLGVLLGLGAVGSGFVLHIPDGDDTWIPSPKGTRPAMATVPLRFRPKNWPKLATADFACPQMTHRKRNSERNVEINVEVGLEGKCSIPASC
jgi:hypothetical protein